MTAKRTIVVAPEWLRPETAAWWLDVVGSYDLEPHHVRLLSLAAEAWDRSSEAREVIARDGIVITTPGGVRAHPAVAIERDARLAFARLLREIDLWTRRRPRIRGRLDEDDADAST